MLIIWHSELWVPMQEYLISLDTHASYWPRSYVHTKIYDAAIPLDWWISFSHPKFGIVWMLKYPEYSEIVYKD